jgi:hypothetical protein
MAELDPAAVVQDLASDPRLRVFTGSGRIETIPARQSRRRMLLDVIARAFEPDVRYPEGQVSQFLGELHPDFAALRRYLVDEHFLSRSGGEYWRSGGSVPTGSSGAGLLHHDDNPPVGTGGTRCDQVAGAVTGDLEG